MELHHDVLPRLVLVDDIGIASRLIKRPSKVELWAILGGIERLTKQQDALQNRGLARVVTSENDR